MSQGLRLASYGLLALLLTACLHRPSGTLELRLRLEDGAAGIRSVEIDPDWAGASRHPHRDAGWHRISLIQDRLALQPGGPSVIIARGSLAAGTYDRVLVSSPLIHAIDEAGSAHMVISHVEPIARGFELAEDETIRIEIRLTLRPGVDPATPLEAFVKHAEVLEAGEEEPTG